MAKYEIDGYFNNKQCERIKEKVQGKTYLNFNVEYGGIAGNNTMIITSNIEGCSDKELETMFIFYALNQI